MSSGTSGGIGYAAIQEIVSATIEAILTSIEAELVIIDSRVDGLEALITATNLLLATPTIVFNGNTNVAVAGTAVAIAGATVCKSVTVKAKSTNTGFIYVGNAGVTAANGFQLQAGEAISMDIADLATVFVNSSVSGEGITYLGVV